ncbi:RNA polymerase sigma factor [Edaphobacter flagellatus]|uniref:RNA polymerase sigma factor n=1 Tax=Edaphobacter flagellatus TaxID=1933044 RepID=UPI0021B42F06|nr:RNA polymerase sigma factor [Edaphobacter flagellatus]
MEAMFQEQAQHAEQAHLTADAVARRSYGKLVAFLAARTHNVASAEDALSDAFAAALADWPRNGCPQNPEAWLLTAARRKLIDASRRRNTSDAAVPQLQLLAEEMESASTEPSLPDRRLGLMFACAHPAIDVEVRAPLMLQVVVGLDAKTIASAFLMSPAAMSKRLVRAKTKIQQAGIPFHIPERDELASRLDAVLDSIYAAFAEGWTDPGGTDLARRNLTEEAFFLARLLVELLPNEPEPLGLLALMLYADARRNARRSKSGDYIPLAQQDTTLWNDCMIDEAETLLRHVSAFETIGRYQIEAAIQSAHIMRHRSGHDNWPTVVELYNALATVSCSPVVAINRALAIAEAEGPRAGLDAMPRLADDARLNQYQPFWAARAELLSRIGASNKAREAYDIAIGLERDPAVRSFLQQRLAALTVPRTSVN